jgi:uncharacterized membrane protein YoaK (UPF0700 family)
MSDNCPWSLGGDAVSCRSICGARTKAKGAKRRSASTLELLSFNAAFVDGAGFLGLQGLFTADATGNFVALGAAMVFGISGIVTKLLALPEFLCLVAGCPIGAFEAPSRHVIPVPLKSTEPFHESE